MVEPLCVRRPPEVVAKPGDGEAPVSHWTCEVGGVTMQPRPAESVRPELARHTWAGPGRPNWLILS